MSWQRVNKQVKAFACWDILDQLAFLLFTCHIDDQTLTSMAFLILCGGTAVCFGFAYKIHSSNCELLWGKRYAYSTLVWDLFQSSIALAVELGEAGGDNIPDSVKVIQWLTFVVDILLKAAEHRFETPGIDGKSYNLVDCICWDEREGMTCREMAVELLCVSELDHNAGDIDGLTAALLMTKTGHDDRITRGEIVDLVRGGFFGDGKTVNALCHWIQHQKSNGWPLAATTAPGTDAPPVAVGRGTGTPVTLVATPAPPSACALRDQVMAMGFDAEVASLAAQRCSSVEACIEWMHGTKRYEEAIFNT